MALFKTITKDIPLAGMVSVPSYCRVSCIRGGKEMIEATMTATKDDSDGALVEAFVVHFVPSLDGKNFIAQAYDHFKALPQLAGASDC